MLNLDLKHIQNTKDNKDFKWFNCVNPSCRKHLAKILQPNGLIEIKFGHGKNKKFDIVIHGSLRYTCPHCSTPNIIAFIDRKILFKPVNDNGIKYSKNIKALEANNNNQAQILRR